MDGLVVARMCRDPRGFTEAYHASRFAPRDTSALLYRDADARSADRHRRQQAERVRSSLTRQRLTCCVASQTVHDLGVIDSLRQSPVGLRGLCIRIYRMGLVVSHRQNRHYSRQCIGRPLEVCTQME